MDDRVREKSFDRAVGEPSSFGFGDVRELEVVDVGGRHVANGRDPEERERLLNALGLGVHDAGLELDAHLDPDRRRVRDSDLPSTSYRTREITMRPGR